MMTSSPGFRPSVTMVRSPTARLTFTFLIWQCFGNDKDLGSLLAFHDRGCGHSQGVGLIGELDGYIHELAWPKSVIRIRKGGLEGDHARDPIHCVINNVNSPVPRSRPLSGSRALTMGLLIGHPLTHFGERTFMQGKRDINRLH